MLAISKPRRRSAAHQGARMRLRHENAPKAGRLSGAHGNTNQHSHDATLATDACRCGGPGGKPGSSPVCPTCRAFDRIARAVDFSRLIGLSQIGFAP